MAQQRLEADIVIVGAGPTGLTIANFLGGMGVSVILVERNLSTVQEPRAVSIDDEAMRTMQAIGLDAAVSAIVASGYGSHYYSPSRQKFLIVEPSSLDYGFPKRNAFQQPELEAVLREGLSRYPQVQQFFGWEFAGLRQDAASVGGTIRNLETGEELEISGKYLVASDGGRSPIRTGLNIQMQGSTFTERWLIVDLYRTNNRFRHTEVFCDPGRPCLTLPGPSGIRRYEFMLFPHENELAVTDHGFVRDLLRRVGPDGDEEFRRVAVYTFHARLAERWREGRVFLAGDAAHLTPPFAGQGMNSGLRDAHNLSWKLAEALHSPAPDRLLDSYQIERSPHAQDMINLALRMGQVMMPHTHLKAWAIRTAFKLLSISAPAREYFSQMKYKPKPRIRDGLIWADGLAERQTMIGRLLPQPLVETLAREKYLLDTLLVDKPVAIVFDEFPDRALSEAHLAALEAAGLQVVGITPSWMNPVASKLPVYRDTRNLYGSPQMRSYLSKVFLLRRDRYVAAIAPASNPLGLIDIAKELSSSIR